MEIAQKIKTSVSYVSQQLKLLEAAGIVKKEKTGSVEKGKPRLVYSVVKETVQISALLKGSPVKKSVALNDKKKITMRIWALKDDLHYPVEKLFWKIEDNLKDVDGIFVDVSGKGRVLVVTKNAKVRAEVDKFSREGKVDCKVVSERELGKNVYTIYDPNSFGKERLKGGKEEGEQNDR